MENKVTVTAQINNAIEHAKNSDFNNAFDSLSKALDCSSRTRSELNKIDEAYNTVKKYELL